MNDVNPDWLLAGQGLAPQLRWTFSTDAPLVCLGSARESGELFAADASGGLYCLDRRGKILSLTRGLREVRAISWSDTGDAGVVILGDSRLCRLNRKMEIEWTVELSDSVMAVAISPYGNYVGVSLADGGNIIFDANRKRVGRFETIRPLRFLQFLVTETAIVGAAEYGLLCCHQLDGRSVWDEKTWFNVGSMSVTGDGAEILLTGFNHGIQVFDDEGTNRASYKLEGTVNRVAASFTADRMVAITVEHHLYWLDADGEMLWATEAPEDVLSLVCDPLGEWVNCGFASGRIVRLDWESA